MEEFLATMRIVVRFAPVDGASCFDADDGREADVVAFVERMRIGFDVGGMALDEQCGIPVCVLLQPLHGIRKILVVHVGRLDTMPQRET